MPRPLNLVFAYRLLICLLVILGSLPLIRLPEKIGRLYLGVPITTLQESAFWVNVEASSRWPGFQAGLRGGDRILSVEGRSLDEQPQVLEETIAGRREGDLVQVEVQRGASRLTLGVPLRRYHLSEALEFYGVWFLAGLTSVLAGWLLSRPPTVLMALVLTLIAGIVFHHNYTGFADVPFSWRDLKPTDPFWSYGYALIGALLLHFTWRFPPDQRAEGFLRWPVSGRLLGLYGLAFALGTVHQFVQVMRWIDVTELVVRLGMLLAAFGAISGLVRIAWVWTRREPGQAGGRVIAGVWGLGLVLLLGVGVVPFWSSDEGALLAQFLLSLYVIYPLLLVYAIRQVELVETLEHAIAEKQRWADLAQELQRFREADLRRVANELHDTVLANLRAAELRLESLLPQADAATTPDSPPSGAGRSSDGTAVQPPSQRDLQMLRETVHQIEEQARRVTLGALPLDFQEVGLREALQDALDRFKRTSPTVQTYFEVGPFDAEPPPAVREAAYWIAISALNNCHEHAQASHVRLFVSSQAGNVQVTVQDDGVGFQDDKVTRWQEPVLNTVKDDKVTRASRVTLSGLGLRNMRARAAAVGGELQIESSPQGTTVRFSLILPRKRPIRVLLVEDSEAFATGLQTALARWAQEIEVVGVAGNAQDALSLAQTLRPDLVLLDLRIGKSPEVTDTNARHGLQALLELGRMADVRSVLMSFAHDPAWQRAAVEAGAWGFWDQDRDVASLVTLLCRVAAGERVWPPEVLAAWAAVGQKVSLSRREWEVLFCLEQGLSNQEISRKLQIADGTTAKHVEKVLKKLGARSRSEAVARARALGLLSADRPDLLLPEHP